MACQPEGGAAFRELSGAMELGVGRADEVGNGIEDNENCIVISDVE